MCGGKRKGEKGVEDDKLKVEVEVERATEEGSGQNGSFHFWGTGSTIYPGRSDTRALGERRDSLDAGTSLPSSNISTSLVSGEGLCLLC